MAIEFRRMRQGEFLQGVCLNGYQIISAQTRVRRGTFHADPELCRVVVARGMSAAAWYQGENCRYYAPLQEQKPIYRAFAALDYRDEAAILDFYGRYGFIELADFDGICDYSDLGGPAGMRWLAPVETETDQTYFWYEPLIDIQEAILLMRTRLREWEIIQTSDDVCLLASVAQEKVAWEATHAMKQQNESALLYSGSLVPLGQTMESSALYNSTTVTGIPELDKVVQGQVDLKHPDPKAIKAYGTQLPPLEILRLRAESALTLSINDRIKNALVPYLSAGPKYGTTALNVRPRNLLAVMYIQLAQVIAREKTYRKCKACENWFEIVRAHRTTRSDKEYCSDACRMKACRDRKRRADSEE